ncbi:uncharacterized protein LOC136041546 isoform X2 [Artemia franciscana]|uniref:uncharacterized protein LOC136041546 isoform X2 n=1 Tax=Artemia franciscana TaxID=6661 RepID=UPI0032D9BDE8
MDVPQTPNMTEPITIPETDVVKKEVEEALPSDHEELFDFPNQLLSFKREDVPVGTFGCFSQPCKLEPDTQELGSACCDSEEAEYTSPSDVDMIRETSNSILSPEHQQLPLNVASRISNLTSVLDSQDLEEAVDTSSIETETIRETSISTLLPEHQRLPVGIASRISHLTSELDSQNLDSNDKGIFETSSVVKLV